MKLVIVESPNKIEKLSKLLGTEFKVMASVGHIRDLPENAMGVEAPYYKPHYEVSKPEVVKRLKEASKTADDILLASDPDREGEAIAFHLKEVLRLDNPKRITFNEITKAAVQAAISKPRLIDENLVQAQEARRVLDRLVGYRVSSSLSEAAGQRLSAGRVQTPALRIVVDREREILNFKVANHYGVQATFENDGIQWQADWDFKPLLATGETTWTDRNLAAQVSGLRLFVVQEITKTQKPRSAPAPFTTSTLQQAASIKLKFKPARTMELAQALFADGLITYHRTDTPNLSEEATQEIWGYLKTNGMADYVPEKRNVWKSKEGAQEAHEAIRPTHIADRQPDIKDKDAARLYELIWLRAVACQMKPALYDVTAVKLQSIQEIEGKPQYFKATGRTVAFDGWLKLTADDATEEEKEEIQTLPVLSEGLRLQASECKLLNKKTKPPSRYSEAALVKELEAQGIGRPSTYASIMATIFSRGYVADKDSRLIPTELGFKVIDALAGKFAFAELSYTKNIEGNLDLIAEGKGKYRQVVSEVDNLLTDELGKMQKVDIDTSHPCTCGNGSMRRKKGPKGNFWGCSNYPECKITLPDEKGKPGQRKEKTEPPAGEQFKCPKCNEHSLTKRLAKTGANKGKPFWGCAGWPACNYTAQDKEGKPVNLAN